MITFYTDGACKGNPGPGGYSVVGFHDMLGLCYSYNEQCEKTTNNREELKALIKACIIINEMREPAIIYSDSAYCVNIWNDWIYKWANNDWKNSKDKLIENFDLIQILYEYCNTNFFACQVQVLKIAGHAGHLGNELADALACNNMTRFIEVIERHRKEGYKLLNYEDNTAFFNF